MREKMLPENKSIVETDDDGVAREEDDGFNGYGSGPVPIKEREPSGDQ